MHTAFLPCKNRDPRPVPRRKPDFDERREGSASAQLVARMAKANWINAYAACIGTCLGNGLDAFFKRLDLVIH